jgi:hypothetical protein
MLKAYILVERFGIWRSPTQLAGKLEANVKSIAQLMMPSAAYDSRRYPHHMAV